MEEAEDFKFVFVVYCVLESKQIICGMGFCVWSLFCYALLSVFSSFAVILTRKR